MKVNLKSTTKIVELNGVPARVWEGETESGIKVHAFITRIAIDSFETRTEEFEAELKQQAPPSVAVQSIPLRMII